MPTETNHIPETGPVTKRPVAQLVGVLQSATPPTSPESSVHGKFSKSRIYSHSVHGGNIYSSRPSPYPSKTSPFTGQNSDVHRKDSYNNRPQVTTSDVLEKNQVESIMDSNRDSYSQDISYITEVGRICFSS